MLFRSFTTGFAAVALITAPTVATAQVVPQQEVISASEESALRGNPQAFGIILVLLAILLFIFEDEIFGDDGELEGPVSP